MQKQTQGFGQAGEKTGSMGGARSGNEGRLSRFAPARERCRLHPQPVHHFGLAAKTLRQRVRPCAIPRRFKHRPAGYILVEDCDKNKKRAAAQRQPSQHRVENKYRPKENRRPGEVKNSKKRGRRQQPLDGLEVLQPRIGMGPRLCRYSAFERDFKYPFIEHRLHPGANLRRDPPAGIIKHPHNGVQHHNQHKQGNQRFFGARPEHPVIYLQHKQRAGQHQQVRKNAKEPDRKN